MAQNVSRSYVCTNGHEFGVTNWGTAPLGCPRCRAQYKPMGRGGSRKPSPPMASPASTAGAKRMVSGSYLATSDGRAIKC